MSKTINIGKVALTPKGRWSEDVEYESLDAVTHSGCLWVANDSNVGEEPSEENEHWSLALDGSESVGSGTIAEVTAFLPDEIYVALGRTVEIYNASVCADSDKYRFKWICDVGKAYGRKFSITGDYDFIGEYPLTLQIYDRLDQLVYSKVANVKIASTEALEDLMICPLGDVYSAGKSWLEEVQNLSGSAIEFVGPRESESGIYHAGVAGWDTNTFLYSNDAEDLESGELESNMFCQGTRFEWSWFHYATEVSGVQLFFGERELLNVSAEQLAENLCEMITSIRLDNACPVFVVLPPLWGTQDGMARQTTEGAGLDFSGKTKSECDKIIISAAKTIVKNITAKGFSNVYFVPLLSCFDSENNMETEEIAVNPRVSVTQTVQKGAVQPSDAGYKQMADVFFSAYCAVFN
ncbi:MAG: hypothetical protein IKB02_02575 [Clostridia bacterium]|nr:hypothetical protein [Clostridia bacterium]